MTYNNKGIINIDIVRDNYGLIKLECLDKIVFLLKNKKNDNNTLILLTNFLLNGGYSVKLILESFSEYFKNKKILNEENLCKFYFKISDIDNFSNLSGNQFIATLSILNYLAILLMNN
jgi:hypothetical protein